MNVFIASFELGASLASSELEFAGGFVSVAVVAPDIRKSLDWAENALKEDGYQIRIIESVHLYDPGDEWEEELRGIAQEASKSGAVTYGIFYNYSQSELH